VVPVPVLNLGFYSYDVKFVGMVLSGDELTVKLRHWHIGMRDGNIVVNIETSNARGEKVIQGMTNELEVETRPKMCRLMRFGQLVRFFQFFSFVFSLLIHF
jgi:acyl dehydratase